MKRTIRWLDESTAPLKDAKWFKYRNQNSADLTADYDPFEVFSVMEDQFLKPNLIIWQRRYWMLVLKFAFTKLLKQIPL